MAKSQKPTKKNLPAYLYRVSNSGPNRLHIEIPSKDRGEFHNGESVIVIPYDDQIRKSLKKMFGENFSVASGAPRQ